MSIAQRLFGAATGTTMNDDDPPAPGSGGVALSRSVIDNLISAHNRNERLMSYAEFISIPANLRSRVLFPPRFQAQPRPAGTVGGPSGILGPEARLDDDDDDAAGQVFRISRFFRIPQGEVFNRFPIWSVIPSRVVRPLPLGFTGVFAAWEGPEAQVVNYKRELWPFKARLFRNCIGLSRELSAAEGGVLSVQGDPAEGGIDVESAGWANVKEIIQIELVRMSEMMLSLLTQPVRQTRTGVVTGANIPRIKISFTMRNNGGFGENERPFYIALPWGPYSLVLRNLHQQLSNWMVQYEFTEWRFENLLVTLCPSVANLIQQVEGAGLSAQNWVTMNDKYWLVSFRAMGNCVFRTLSFLRQWKEYLTHGQTSALGQCKSWDDVQKLLHNLSRNLKYRMEQTHRELDWGATGRFNKTGNHNMPWDQIGLVAEELKIHLRVYNNIFTCTHEWNHGTFLADTMVLDGHMVACIPISTGATGEWVSWLWKETAHTLDMETVITTLPEKMTELHTKVTNPRAGKQTKFRGIRVSYNQDETDEKARSFVHEEWLYGSLDFETFCNSQAQNKLCSYASAWVCESPVPGEPPIFRLYYKRNCEDEMMREMHDLLRPEDENEVKNIVMYGHFAAKFDFYILLVSLRDDPQSVWELRSNSLIVQNGAVVCMDLWSKEAKNFRIRFLDSYRQLPMPLDRLTKELQVEHGKLKDAYRHGEVDEAFLANHDNQKMITKYLEHDVLGLWEAITKHRDLIWEKYEIQLAQCVTAASLSKSVFLQCYYEPAVTPLVNMPRELDQAIRESYFGGRCEVFRQGQFQKPNGIFYYDVTSLYPAMMMKELPYGYCKHFENVSMFRHLIRNRRFFGFMKVKARHASMHALPLHAVRHAGKLVFPHLREWTTLTIFSEEYYLSKDENLGYEYEILEGWMFAKKAFFAPFVQDLFKEKAAAKARGDKGLTLLTKLLLNSAYGWTAFRTSDKSSVECHPTEKRMHCQYLLQNELVDVAPFQEGYMIMSVKKELTDVQNFNVSIGSAVTAYARMHLYRILHELRKRHFELFYCDTDSVITDCDLSKPENRDLLLKFAADGLVENRDFDARSMGVTLGSLKSEGQEIHKDYEGSKELVGFDEAIFLLPKMYVLRKKHGEDWILKGASKGFSRRDPYLVRFMDDVIEDTETGVIIGEPEAYLCTGKNFSTRLGRWDWSLKCFVNDKGEKVVVNGFYVNQNFHELDDRTLTVVRSSAGGPVFRGPPLWEDYETIASGGTVRRSMRSLTQTFRKVFSEEGEGMLRQSDMTRRATLIDEHGNNRYNKGVVGEGGYIRPLILPSESEVVLRGPVTEAGLALEQCMQTSADAELMENLGKWHNRFFPNDVTDAEVVAILEGLHEPYHEEESTVMEVET